MSWRWIIVVRIRFWVTQRLFIRFLLFMITHVGLSIIKLYKYQTRNEIWKNHTYLINIDYTNINRSTCYLLYAAKNIIQIIRPKKSMHTKYRDYSLGLKIRNIISEGILPLITHHQHIQSTELQSILINLFKFREYEITYQKMKILSFGKNKYISITLEEYIDYVAQNHLGKNSINHFVYSNGYLRNDEKMMDRDEFIQTFMFGLSFVEVLRSIPDLKEQLSLIYQQVDVDNDAYISFLEYESFLREYLGSQSPMSIDPTQKIKELSQSEVIQSQKNLNNQQSSIIHHNAIKLSNLNDNNQKKMFSNKEVNAYSLVNMNSISKFQSAVDEFQDLIYSQINSKCFLYDKNGDGYLFRKEFQTFLYDVLELQYNSINFISDSYFHSTSNAKVSLKEFTQIVCEIHFREIFTSIIKSELRQTLSQRCTMSLNYFITKITENCFFFINKPTFQLLQRFYEQLIAKSQNTHRKEITLEDFNSFIVKYCCNNKLKLRQSINRKTNKNLSKRPVSIKQVQNSNYEQDQSENNDLKPIQSDSSQIRSRRSKSIKQMTIQNGQSSAFHFNNVVQPKEISLYTHLQSKFNYVDDNQMKKQHNQKQKEIDDTKMQKELSLINQPQQSFTKIETEELFKQEFGVKEELWSRLQKIFIRYSSKSIGFLTKYQFQSLSQKEKIMENKIKFIKNILKLFQKELYLSIEMIIKYYIHFTGEQALLNFNKVQIKGKSMLSLHQAAEILFSAYHLIFQRKKESFIQFFEGYLAKKMLNGFHYKNFLQFISRNLSIKTIY